MKAITTTTVILFLFVCPFLYGQDENTDEKKSVTHYVYVTPSAIPGLLLDFNLFNYWAEAGYGILINKSMINFDAGMIVYSEPSEPSKDFINITKQLHQVKSTGYYFALEYKHNIQKRFTVSAQIYYHKMKTTREEKYFYHDYYNGYYTPVSGVSNYDVNRTEIGIIPKLGWAIIDKKRVSCDVSFGVGMCHISSSSIGKNNPDSNRGLEFLSFKPFDNGSQWAFRVLPQFRIGYAF